MTSVEPEPGNLARCGECGAPLASDQAYCIVCGARTRPLPARVAVAIFDIEQHGRAIASDDPRLAEPDEEDEPDDIVSAARAGVVALLAMLAVGVVIGGLTTSGGLAGLANTIVLAFKPGVQQAAQVVATNPGGGGGGGGGGGHAAPPAPRRSGGAPAAATTAAPATTPAPVTVTVPNTTSTVPPADTGTTPPTPALPPIGHVWLIVLSQQGYSQSFGTSAGHPYLDKLRRQGELIVNYDAVATSPLANEIALLSGQGPTNATIANCPTYSAVSPGRTAQADTTGQVHGGGCIYPASTPSLPQQFLDDGLQWKAYVQGIGGKSTSPCPTGSASSSSSSESFASTSSSSSSSSTSPSTSTTSSSSSTTPPGCSPTTTGSSSSSTSTIPSSSSTISSSTSSGAGSADAAVNTIGQATCPHPAPGALSLNQSVGLGGGTYVNWKNPIIYFQSLLERSGQCSTNDVGLPALARDLENPGATPSFSYVAPDPCHDGSDTPCTPGAKAGLGPADGFLQQVVPEIETSPAYQQSGLILITFDEAPQSGPHWDTSSCCDQPVFPNLPSPTTSGSTSSSSSSSTTVAAAPPATGTTPGSAAPTSPATTSTTAATGCATASSSASSTTSPTAPPPTGTLTTETSSTVGDTCTPAIAGNPPGGGQVGLLMISPYVKPDKLDVEDTLNHFSLLKSIEALFQLHEIGYAHDTALQGFGPQMFLSTKR